MLPCSPVKPWRKRVAGTAAGSRDQMATSRRDRDWEEPTGEGVQPMDGKEEQQQIRLVWTPPPKGPRTGGQPP